MKLSISEIRALKQLLQVDGDVSPDGKPVLRKFSTKDFSAYNWFYKNTEDIEKAYNEFIKSKQADLTKKYKKEQDKEDAEFKAIKALLVTCKENEQEKELLTQLKGFMESQSVKGKINIDLNSDEEIKTKSKEEHEVEIKDPTKDLVKRILETAQFTAQDIVFLKIVEKFA